MCASYRAAWPDRAVPPSGNHGTNMQTLDSFSSRYGRHDNLTGATRCPGLGCSFRNETCRLPLLPRSSPTTTLPTHPSTIFFSSSQQLFLSHALTINNSLEAVAHSYYPKESEPCNDMTLFHHILMLLGFLPAMLMGLAACDECAESYKACDPDGASLRDVPIPGPDLGRLYLEMLYTVNSAPAEEPQVRGLTSGNHDGKTLCCKSILVMSGQPADITRCRDHSMLAHSEFPYCHVLGKDLRPHINFI
jgi:hypothetical protein